MNNVKRFLGMAALLGAAMSTEALAQVTLQESAGWKESAYATWQNDLTTYKSYNAYYKAEGGSYTKLDKELVRNYGSYGRADVVGIKAGKYQIKVVGVKSDGNEDTANAAETGVMEVAAYDRTGFAFSSQSAGTTGRAGQKFNINDGLGAYKLDGTLKDDALVLYVTANNAKTIKADIVTGDKNKKETLTGIQTILDALQKGYETRPICVRLLGTVKKDNLDKITSSAEGLQIKGRSGYDPIRLTIEGIGNDATIHGFGFLIRNCCDIELRNFAIMLCLDDCVSMDTKNEHVWIHNLDLFYGSTGGDADQAKGDGTLDLKGNSQYITMSYCHFFDSGKSSLCGMDSETAPNYITYHHNWFDHSDSRHPRIRTMSVHVYNNYYDGISKYGVGATTGSSAFVESNYFRNCKYPMLSSKQGTDGAGDGTFSGETGGIIKSFGNKIVNARAYVTYQQNSTDFDAYEASSRDEIVPETVKTKKGGTSYDNFDTNASIMYACTPDAAEDVPAIVMGYLGAGRMGKGDFKWQFDNAKEDENYGVNQALKNEITNYKSALVDFYDGVKNLNNGTYAATGGDAEKHPDYVPSWGSSSVTPGEGGNGTPTEVVGNWDFTKWSSETQAAIKAADSGWAQKSDGTERYSKALTDQSAGLAETEGITFTGSPLVSFDSGKGNYIQGSFSMTFSVQEGDVVTVVFANTGNSNGERTLLANETQIGASSSTAQVTATYTVKSGETSVTLKGSNGLNYFSIKISRSAKEEEDINTAINDTDAEIASVEYYTLSGQRMTSPKRGICIVRTTYANGSTKAKAMMVK